MTVYRELYYQLRAMIADAVASLENNEPLAARKTLVAAMREAEEAILSAEEEP